jgi:hypothetical protein
MPLRPASQHESEPELYILCFGNIVWPLNVVVDEGSFISLTRITRALGVDEQHCRARAAATNSYFDQLIERI